VWAEFDLVECSRKYRFAWNQLTHHSWLAFAKLSSYIVLRVTQLQGLNLSQIWIYSFQHKLCYFLEDLLWTKKQILRDMKLGFSFIKSNSFLRLSAFYLSPVSSVAGGSCSLSFYSFCFFFSSSIFYTTAFWRCEKAVLMSECEEHLPLFTQGWFTSSARLILFWGSYARSEFKRFIKSLEKKLFSLLRKWASQKVEFLSVMINL